MADLFTKAANVKTITKLWVIGIALLIMVNVPYADDHNQSRVVPASPASSPNTASSVKPLIAALGTPAQIREDDRAPHAALLTSSLPLLDGNYTGTVENLTTSLTADFTIRLQVSDGKLTGAMSVSPPLYGSGALTGTTDGSKLTFAVASDIGTITFTGINKGSQITGRYTVQHPSGGRELGSFKLQQGKAESRATQSESIARTDAATVPTPASLPEVTPTTAEPPKVVATPMVHSDPKNYASCMNGFSYACNKRLLNPDEAADVRVSDLRRNVSSCMNGLSYACNRSLLTADEAANVKASDLRRNFSSCMNGLSYACNRSLLTSEERVAVDASELKRNYSSCMNGLSYACNKRLLTPDELSRVQASDLQRNYTSCLTGFSYACNRSLLTSEQLSAVEAKEATRHR